MPKLQEMTMIAISTMTVIAKIMKILQVKGRPPKSKYDLSNTALAYTSPELNHKVELTKRGGKFYGIDEQELQFFNLKSNL